MTTVLCIIYVLAVLAVIVWLLVELRADRRDQARYDVTTPRDRLPRRSDV